MTLLSTPGPWGLFDGKSSSLDGQQLVLADAPATFPTIDMTTGQRWPDVGFARQTIAIVCEDTERFGEWTPNARLIAAAPDLAENLDNAVALLHAVLAGERLPPALVRNRVDAAEAALAKAGK